MTILGINGQYLHDASACIVKDGILVAYAEEERFSKKKHAIGELPIRSLLSCLNQAGMTITDIDRIAVSWNGITDGQDIVASLLSHEAIKCKRRIPVAHISHHMSHAAAGYFTSGFDRAVVLSVDGSGDGVSTTIAYGEGNRLTEILSLDIDQSLGYFYTGIGSYLGFPVFNEGKTMGLASYGSPRYDFPIETTSEAYRVSFASSVKEKKPLTAVTGRWLFHMYRTFGKEYSSPTIMDPMTGYLRKHPILYDDRAKDIAASAQKKLEEILLHLVRTYTQKLRCRHVVMAGGVALNCSANGKIQRSGLVDELYILPAANDSGNCIGAAMFECSRHMEMPKQPLPTPYWGHSYHNEEIHAVLDAYGLKYEFVDDIAARAAELLTEYKILGWFQGASEMGPRALGNRSIVANPTKRESLLRVNSMVKYRETWRPLAPSVLDDRRDFLLENDSYSPYMLKAFTVRKEVRCRVPAIVHVDNTARPQTVRRQDNPLWYDLIAAFDRLTGIPAVLNTSLNVQGRPICESPIDALQTFFFSGMDHLIMGNFLLSK